MRAIEAEAYRQLNENNHGKPTPVVCDYGDFSFNECGDCTEVIIRHAAVATTLPEDRDFFLAHYHYAGHAILNHHKSAEKKGDTLYSTKEIILWATSPIGNMPNDQTAKDFVDQHWPKH